MPKPWRLTRQAEESLYEIARWTLETFGPRQAEAYEEDLISRCEAIAAGSAHMQTCSDVFDPALPADLRFTRAGGHIVIFVDVGSEIIVIDLLHAQHDLPHRFLDLVSRNDH